MQQASSIVVSESSALKLCLGQVPAPNEFVCADNLIQLIIQTVIRNQFQTNNNFK
jgi:hypothetical protein